MSESKHVHIFNIKSGIIVYDFITKNIQLYNIMHTDWVKKLDRQHEYSFVIYLDEFDFTDLNDLKIRYLRYLNDKFTNFNPKYPELMKTIDF